MLCNLTLHLHLNENIILFLGFGNHLKPNGRKNKTRFFIGKNILILELEQRKF